MAQNGRFLFWRMAIKTPNSANLAPSKISCCTVYFFGFIDQYVRFKHTKTKINVKVQYR